jgi:hypothetical protein
VANTVSFFTWGFHSILLLLHSWLIRRQNILCSLRSICIISSTLCDRSTLHRVRLSTTFMT